MSRSCFRSSPHHGRRANGALVMMVLSKGIDRVNLDTWFKIASSVVRFGGRLAMFLMNCGLGCGKEEKKGSEIDPSEKSPLEMDCQARPGFRQHSPPTTLGPLCPPSFHGAVSAIHSGLFHSTDHA